MAGGIAAWIVDETGIAAIPIVAMTGMAGIAAVEGNGSSRPRFGRSKGHQKPPDSGGFFVFAFSGLSRGLSSQLAGHRQVALLNDALLRRLFRAGSGRIAQLIE